VPAVGEAGHITDVDQDPGRAGRADSEQVHQVRPAGQHRGLESPVDRGELGVSLGVLGDQLDGDLPAGASG
jgi:hypothetical protein